MSPQKLFTTLSPGPSSLVAEQVVQQGGLFIVRSLYCPTRLIESNFQFLEPIRIFELRCPKSWTWSTTTLSIFWMLLVDGIDSTCYWSMLFVVFGKKLSSQDFFSKKSFTAVRALQNALFVYCSISKVVCDLPSYWLHPNAAKERTPPEGTLLPWDSLKETLSELQAIALWNVRKTKPAFSISGYICPFHCAFGRIF